MLAGYLSPGAVTSLKAPTLLKALSNIITIHGQNMWRWARHHESAASLVGQFIERPGPRRGGVPGTSISLAIGCFLAAITGIKEKEKSLLLHALFCLPDFLVLLL